MTMCLSACQSVSCVSVSYIGGLYEHQNRKLGTEARGVRAYTFRWVCMSPASTELSNCRFPSHVRQGMGCRPGQGLLCCALPRHVSDV